MRHCYYSNTICFYPNQQYCNIFMQNLIKRKLSDIKIKRNNKRWKEDSQTEIQPIIIASTTAADSIVINPTPRRQILDSGMIKRNSIYYSDQSYSINCDTYNSRYNEQNNPEESQVYDIGSSLKKKRISRSTRKSKRSFIRLERINLVSSQSNTVILNKLIEKDSLRQQQQFLHKDEIAFEKQLTNQHHQACENQISNQELLQKQELVPQNHKLIKNKQSSQNKQVAIPNTNKQQQFQPKIVTCGITLPSEFQSLKNFFYSPVQPQKRYVCLLKCVNFSLKPRFLLFSNQLKLLLSAQAQLASIGLNYYFFIGEPKAKQDRQYLGKLRGNMFETLFSLYNRGSSFESTDNPGRRRQLLANIITTKQQTQLGSKVLIPRPNIGRKILKQNWRSLQQLQQKVPDSVIEMRCKELKKQTINIESKKTTVGGSKLSNHYRRRMLVKQAETKPIVECEQYKQSLCVKKIHDNLYQISITEPFSIFQAFGVVLGRCKGKLEAL